MSPAAPSSLPLVSIIVPTLNEAQDIPLAAESLAKLRYPNREIIIVDGGSTDRTLEILRPYVETAGFRMIQPGDRGVAEARNHGVRSARGEIVVLITADTCLPEDFLERIQSHYEQGADFVLVNSRIMNQDALFPRFIQAQQEFLYHWQDWVNWTEGFSCRRSAAIAAGLFPEIPGMSAGADAVFAERLAAQFKKVVDPSIVVLHIAPQTFWDYWAQRKGRGHGVPFRNIVAHGYPRPWAFCRALLAAGYAVVRILTVVPILVTSARIARYSPRGMRDLLPFCYAATVEILAARVGEWSACLDLYRTRRQEA